jgi:hypothetical protein
VDVAAGFAVGVGVGRRHGDLEGHGDMVGQGVVSLVTDTST